MALWGISTTTETAANNYALPKHMSENDRNNTPWNCFADVRGWIYRRYHSSEQSGLSTDYYDEVIVPVVGLNTGNDSPGNGANNTGIGSATPVAVFFEDPNRSSRISVGGGATSGFSTTGTAYVHVVWNENVYCSAGATVLLGQFNAAGVSIGTTVATAASVAPNCAVSAYANDAGYLLYNNFNGQISNRVAFAFTASGAGIGTVFRIVLTPGVVGTITDFSGGGTANKSFPADILRNVGGAGTTGSVGIGTTTLTITA
jgi:hypothetical protein